MARSERVRVRIRINKHRRNHSAWFWKLERYQIDCVKVLLRNPKTRSRAFEVSSIAAGISHHRDAPAVMVKIKTVLENIQAECIL